jgi:flagellar hook assembly protein FlgD
MPRPTAFLLHQNVPNPFNAETTIPYELPHPATVCLTVYDLKQQKVKVLVEDEQPAGRYTVRWDGTDAEGRRVGSGVYLYRLAVQNHPDLPVRRMIVLR